MKELITARRVMCDSPVAVACSSLDGCAAVVTSPAATSVVAATELASASAAYSKTKLSSSILQETLIEQEAQPWQRQRDRANSAILRGGLL